MIKLTMKDIATCEVGLNKLTTLSDEGKLPFKVGYHTTKIIKKVEPHLREFHEQRMNLFKKYGTEVFETVTKEDGTEETVSAGFKVDEKDKEILFNKDFEVLLATEVELDNAYPLKIDDLSELFLSMKEISSLEPFVE